MVLEMLVRLPFAQGLAAEFPNAIVLTHGFRCAMPGPPDQLDSIISCVNRPDRRFGRRPRRISGSPFGPDSLVSVLADWPDGDHGFFLPGGDRYSKDSDEVSAWVSRCKISIIYSPVPAGWILPG
jgi:hypothetical protein